MDPRAPRIKELQNELDGAEETRVCLKTLKLCFRGLLTFTHDGIFYLQARGRCLRRIWTDPAITTTSLSSTTINLLPVALFTHTTAQQA